MQTARDICVTQAKPHGGDLGWSDVRRAYHAKVSWAMQNRCTDLGRLGSVNGELHWGRLLTHGDWSHSDVESLGWRGMGVGY